MEATCRVCGALKPKTHNGDWLVALPSELEGAELLNNAGVWCSHDCKRADPAYKPWSSGEEMFDAFDRFGKAHGSDLIGAFAKSRGVSESEARTALEEGFSRGLEHLRRQKEFEFE